MGHYDVSKQFFLNKDMREVILLTQEKFRQVARFAHTYSDLLPFQVLTTELSDFQNQVWVQKLKLLYNFYEYYQKLQNSVIRNMIVGISCSCLCTLD